MLSERLCADKERGQCVLDGQREFMCGVNWDLPSVFVGLRCIVFILSSLAAFFVSLWLSVELCLFTSVCSGLLFFHPYLEKGSWSQLMMIKDMCKKQSALLDQPQSQYLGHSRGSEPFALISSLLQGVSQTVLGSCLVKIGMSQKFAPGMADCFKMDCTRVRKLPKCSCLLAAIIVQIVLASLFQHDFFKQFHTGPCF